MRTLALLLLIPLAAASAPVPPAGERVDQAVARAEADARVASRRLAELEKAAGAARGAAATLKAEQAAAAAAIDAAEARIDESMARLQSARVAVSAHQQRLARRRAPLAALLAGLVNIGRRPPLLALSEGASADELVRLRAILDTATPVIERRSAAVAGAVEQTRRFERAALRESKTLADRRAELVRRQRRFSEVERQFAAQAASLEGEAVIAGDQVLASGERIGSARAEAESTRLGLATARRLAAGPLAPARPMAGDAPLPAPDFAYRLPVDGAIRDGLGSVSAAGVRSRGISVAALRGAVVTAPAAGRILFAAPYRGQDGVVIIDHGRGWTSLLLGVSSRLPKGTTVEPGEPIGRALGPVGVELRRNGTAISPAFISASSELLSNGAKSR